MLRRLGRWGSNPTLSRGPRRPLLPNLSGAGFTPFEKRMLDLKARVVENAPPFLHPDLSFFNPPADSQPFTVTPQKGSVTGFGVPYPGVGAGPVPVISYTVPVGQFAIIRALAIVHIGGNPPDFSGEVIWRVLINGGGITGLNALNAQYGTFANPKQIVLMGVENDIITVTVEVPVLLPNGNPNPGPAGGTSTAASFDGWTYPMSEAVSPQVE